MARIYRVPGPTSNKIGNPPQEKKDDKPKDADSEKKAPSGQPPAK